MPITLMCITNDPDVARIAEKNGVDRIWIDLETLGKEERQKNMDCVKSHHTINDIKIMSKVLTNSELMVRINPWNTNSKREIEDVISAGAQRIMLPMWKTPKEVDEFLRFVNQRTATTLLLETKEAAECIDDILCNPLLDEIHIGLNDLHLSYNLKFMFELLANGVVEELCKKMNTAGIKYGFGGIARIGCGLLPAENILPEHYRLGSTRAILSRSFCNPCSFSDIHDVEKCFESEMKKLKRYEEAAGNMSSSDLNKNKQCVKETVDEIVKNIEEKANECQYKRA